MIHPCFHIYIFQINLLICCQIFLFLIYIHTNPLLFYNRIFPSVKGGSKMSHLAVTAAVRPNKNPVRRLRTGLFFMNICEFFQCFTAKRLAPFISVCRNSCSSADGKTRAPDISSGLRSAGPAVSYCLWQRLWQSRYPIRQAGLPRSAAFHCKNW